MKSTSPDEWEIEPYGGKGLTFNTPAYQDTLSMKFDGKDYEEMAKITKKRAECHGSMSSGKHVNARTLDVTDKVKGQTRDTSYLPMERL